MALLTPVQITRAGTTITLVAAAAGGDTYDNANAPTLEINNASGSPITVYAAIYADGQTIIQGRAWAIAAGARVRIAAMTGQYSNPANGQVSLTYSGVTTLTVGVHYI